MRCAVIDTQGARPSSNVHTKGLPGEWLLEDPLPEVTRKKKCIWLTATQGSKESEVCNADVLRFVHDGEIEHHALVF